MSQWKNSGDNLSKWSQNKNLISIMINYKNYSNFIYLLVCEVLNPFTGNPQFPTVKIYDVS